MTKLSDEDNPLHIQVYPTAKEVIAAHENDMRLHATDALDRRWNVLRTRERYVPNLNIFTGYPLSVNKFLSKEVLVLGQTGCGKTNLVASTIEELLYVQPPLSMSVIDVVGDYVSIKDLPGMRDIVTVIGSTDEADIQFPKDQKMIEEFAVGLASRCLRKQGAYIFDLSETPNEDMQFLFLNAYLRKIYSSAIKYYKRNQKTVHVVVLDEAQKWIAKNTGGNRLMNQMKIIGGKIAREGRRYGVSCILATQKNQDIDLSITSQARTLIMMRVNSNADFELYSRLYGEPRSWIHSIVSHLKEGEFLYLPQEGLKIPYSTYDNQGNWLGTTVALRARVRDSFHASKTPDWDDHVASVKRAKLKEQKDAEKVGGADG